MTKKRNKFSNHNVDEHILFQIMEKCAHILKSKKIVDIRSSSVEREAYFVFLIVLLEVLIKNIKRANFHFKRKFTDLQNFESIEDLLREVRNACCHIDSGNNYIDQNAFYRFTTKLGTDGKYPDDATICFGKLYILYWRHIVFAFWDICEFFHFPFKFEETLLKYSPGEKS